MKIGRESGSGGVACGSGGCWILGDGLDLNKETFELEREEQKKRATCKSTFFPAIFSFFKRGAQENSSELFQQVI